MVFFPLLLNIHLFLKTVVMFIMFKFYYPPKCPLTDKWMNKMHSGRLLSFDSGDYVLCENRNRKLGDTILSKLVRT